MSRESAEEPYTEVAWINTGNHKHNTGSWPRSSMCGFSRMLLVLVFELEIKRQTYKCPRGSRSNNMDEIPQKAPRTVDPITWMKYPQKL